MSWELSVTEAIRAGHRRVTIPSLVLIPLLAVASYYLPLREYTVILMPETILLSLIAAVIFRGKAITKWRIWAFENVRNVHELRHRAILSRLIPGKESKILEKLEIWSTADRLRWEELQQRFEKADVYVDDPDVPVETVIRFSRWKQSFYIFLSLVSIGVGGLWVFFPKDDPRSWDSIWSYVLGTAVICFGGGFFWIAIHDLLNRDSQLVIGNDGIKRLGGECYSWKEIYDEKILRKGFGKSTSYHLNYICPRGMVDMTLSGLDIGKIRLDRLLHVYRNRSKAR